MEAQAITRHIRQSPRKIKIILDEIENRTNIDLGQITYFSLSPGLVYPLILGLQVVWVIKNH